MSIHRISYVLLWCCGINYVILMTWFLLYVLPHQWMYRLYGKWFRLSEAQIDGINLAGIAFYKLGILLFNLVPYIALRITG